MSGQDSEEAMCPSLEFDRACFVDRRRCGCCIACADEFASIGQRLLGLAAVQETQVYAVAILPPLYLFLLQFDLSLSW